MIQCVFINFVSAILFIIFVNLMTCQNWKDVAFINQNMYHHYCWQYANIIGTMCYFCLFIYFFYTDTHSLLYISQTNPDFLTRSNVNELTNFPKLSTWMVGDEKRCRWLRHMRGSNSWKSALSTSPFYGSSGVRSALSWCHCMMRTLAIENNTRVTSSMQFQTENMSVYSTTTLMRKILNIRWWVT